MTSTVHRAPDDMVRVLDEDGEVVGDAEVPDLDDDEFVELYRYMKLLRRFDERAVSLQRQGRIGTYPPVAGQEGAQVGSAMALEDSDWVIPSYRENAAIHVHGLSLRQVLQYWMGDENGSHIPEDVNVFPIAIPIASQIPHATGMAWASKLKGETETAVLCYFGDGATSEGDFHEGLNLAGVFDTPNVFFCNNNQWAISVPRERQTAAATLAQKADAYGFEGVQVDGMDPLAVYTVTRDALEKAKDPGEDELRPTLVEAVQYRYGAHTTADDPSVYREEAEVEEWKRKDPIPRLEQFLRRTGRLDDDDVAAIESAAEDRVADAIAAAEETPHPDPAEMFKNVYAEMPQRLEEQLKWFESVRDEHGDEALLED